MLQAAAMQGPQLRDIHLPAPPSWWPPAPGWWLLAILVLALCTALFLYFRRKMQHRRRRRALLAEFERAAAARTDAPALAAALSAFLRRLAIRTTPSAATLAGEAWLAHLDARLGGEEFSRGVGRALVEAPYRPLAEFDAPALIALVRRAATTMIDEALSSARPLRGRGLGEGALSTLRRSRAPLTPALSPNDEAVGGEGTRIAGIGHV